MGDTLGLKVSLSLCMPIMLLLLAQFFGCVMFWMQFLPNLASGDSQHFCINYGGAFNRGLAVLLECGPFYVGPLFLIWRLLYLRVCRKACG